MTQWLPAAILSLISFGLWGIFSKLAVSYIDSKSALVFQTLGAMLMGVIALYLVNFKPAIDMRGISFGVLTGVAASVGCLFFFIAADKGKLIPVVTLTALYPFVTILLSFFLLHETVNLKQFFGIVLALIAILLMSQ